MDSQYSSLENLGHHVTDLRNQVGDLIGLITQKIVLRKMYHQNWGTIDLLLY